MSDFFTRLFDPSGFVPRRACGDWTRGLVWLHNVSDALIWLAYLAIPFVLLVIARRRKDVPFRGVYFLFIAFIVTCGFTHFIDVVMFYNPLYRLSGLVKAVTAVASWATVFALVPVLPKALAMRSPEELQREIDERRRAEGELRALHAELEERVGLRTAELEEAVAALREGEERFRSAFDSAPIGMALVALDGRWLQMNRSLCELVGFTEQELLATDFQTLTHPDDLDADLGQARKLLDSTTRSYQMEKRYFHKQGQIVHTLLSVSLVRDGNGQPLYFVKQVKDITQQKGDEKALAASEELLRQFIKHSPAAIAMFDRDMRYIRTSDRWLIEYHLSGRDVVGLSHYHVFPDHHDRWKAVQQRVLAGSVEQCEEDLFERTDGSTDWLRWECRPWRNAEGEVGGIIMFTQVITQRKSIEEQIKTSLREKEVMLKEIHHRVKNNLQVVSTLLDLQSGHTTDPAAVEMFKESRGRVKSMALIHERLYRSQDMARVDFGEYVRQLTDDLHRTYRVSEGIRLELDVDIPPLAMDIAIPCGLLLNELISNCFKHAFADAAEGCLRVALRRDGGANVLTVADDGAGFPAGTDFRNTTSFGLQLVNTMVDQLDGEIVLTSDRGSTFTVRFPKPGGSSRGTLP